MSSINIALKELTEEFDTSSQLAELLERKLRTIPTSLEPHKVRDRLIRYAMYRGYSYDEISPLLRQLLS